MNSAAVIGVGLIGGSIGLALRRDDADLEVKGYDPEGGVLDVAVGLGAISAACSSVTEAVKDVDICFVACPVGVLATVVREVLGECGDECVVTDVGSTKQQLIESLSSSDLERFIGGHPLAGGEAAGVEHARADLFDGAVWYLTPSPTSRGTLYERLHRIVVDLGAKPQAIDPASHDRVLATVSHLPHVMANVLAAQAVEILDKEDERLPAIGPSFRDMTRVAGSNPAIWTDIFTSNSEAIAAEVDKEVQRLATTAEVLRSKNQQAITAWIEDAQAAKEKLLGPVSEGGPVCQLRVSVPNRPGVVAEVALALGKANVNIIDMTLHPTPDGQSGAISLWVGDKDQAQRAVELIAGLGFPVTRV